MQGDWGEMVLETILENSGLRKDEEFFIQENTKDEEGKNFRPDVIVRFPEGRSVVIDSKVSLTAFVGYTSAETEEERRRCLAAHTASVRQHVNELGRKEYQRLLNSPDFVIMFIPNEPAFLAALQNDAAIWSDAYDKKVIISSPTNLFALLKLVADLWKYNDQDKNTRDIAACGLKLYEQLVAFTGSLEGVGTALDKARDAYDDAYKRLCTGNDNIIRVGERLRRLQWLAVGLAALGVLQQLWQVGSLPWLSLALACSFAFYGLIRKQAPVAALPGLVVETWLLLPAALIWLLLNPHATSAQAAFWGTSDALWLMAAGPVTLLPLLCFNAAARHLPYTTLGFMQYIAPTLVLILAVFAAAVVATVAIGRRMPVGN